MLNLEKIKIGPAGEHLPADAADYVAVLYPALNLMVTAEPINTEEQPQRELEEACTAVSVAGFNDWRMVDIDELGVTVVDRSRRKPAVDPIYRGIPEYAVLWTRTPVVGSPASAWGVHAGYGFVYDDHRDGGGFALAVRSAGQ